MSRIYSTSQRSIIIKAMVNETQEFSMKDIYLKLNKKVGLATIYRLAKILSSEGIIRETVTKKGHTCYHYSSKCEDGNKFYLRCDKCENIISFDCEKVSKLVNHILEEHEFLINQNSILLNGICKNCGDEQNEKSN